MTTINLGLNRDASIIANEHITDESVICLKQKTLRILNLNNCTNITNNGVIELLKNLQLETLEIIGTSANSDLTHKILRTPEINLNDNVRVRVSFCDDHNNFQEVLVEKLVWLIMYVPPALRLLHRCIQRNKPVLAAAAVA